MSYFSNKIDDPYEQPDDEIDVTSDIVVEGDNINKIKKELVSDTEEVVLKYHTKLKELQAYYFVLTRCQSVIEKNGVSRDIAMFLTIDSPLINLQKYGLPSYESFSCKFSQDSSVYLEAISDTIDSVKNSVSKVLSSIFEVFANFSRKVKEVLKSIFTKRYTKFLNTYWDKLLTVLAGSKEDEIKSGLDNLEITYVPKPLLDFVFMEIVPAVKQLSTLLNANTTEQSISKAVIILKKIESKLNALSKLPVMNGVTLDGRKTGTLQELGYASVAQLPSKAQILKLKETLESFNAFRGIVTTYLEKNPDTVTAHEGLMDTIFGVDPIENENYENAGLLKQIISALVTTISTAPITCSLIYLLCKAVASAALSPVVVELAQALILFFMVRINIRLTKKYIFDFLFGKD